MMHGVSLLLISAAAGYWVLTMADKERGRVKQLGQWLGLAIVVISVFGAGCKLWCMYGSDKMGMPAGMACTFGKKAPAP